MIALAIYALALFIIGTVNAVVTYFMLLYRSPQDIVGMVLVIYYITVGIILIGTVSAIDWSVL